MLPRHLLTVFLAGSLCAIVTAATVQEKYPSGRVKLAYETDKEGRKHGFYLEYFDNAAKQVKVRATYKAGELHGLHTTFLPSGKKSLEICYKEGQLHDLETPQGKKVQDAYREYDDKGSLRLSAGYRAGKLHGEVKHYDTTLSGKGPGTGENKPFFSQRFADGELVFARSLAQTRAILAQLEAVPERELKADPLMAEQQAALRHLKAYRFLVGVPYENLELDPEMNRLCTAGARLCEKIDRMDHKPANPGWPEAEYQVAYQGTSQSNLYAVSKGSPNLSRSLDSYMDDSSARNIDQVGHRRWCLNPALKKTGFGKSGRFAAMFAWDRSQANIPDYDFVSYPAAGYMPIAYFRPQSAWNVSLNPEKYKLDESVKVRIYEVDPLLNPVGEPLKLNHLKVQTSGPGLRSCVIFRPEQFKLTDGQRYLVELDGVQPLKGQSPRLRFLVVFVDLKAR